MENRRGFFGKVAGCLAGALGLAATKPRATVAGEQANTSEFACVWEVSHVGTGQQFSSIGAWENWASSQDNPNQWAECYPGGDLGAVTFHRTSWRRAEQ